MRDSITPRQFTRVAVVAFLAFAAVVAVIHSRQDKNGVIAPVEQQHADAESSELARCRTIAPDDSVALENCRRAWADNRRQFFRPTRTPKSGESAPSAATDSGKSQDRIAPNYQQREVR